MGLSEYIDEQLRAGYDVSAIKTQLLQYGYKEQDIERTLSQLYSSYGQMYPNQVEPAETHHMGTWVLLSGGIFLIIILVFGIVYFTMKEEPRDITFENTVELSDPIVENEIIEEPVVDIFDRPTRPIVRDEQPSELELFTDDVQEAIETTDEQICQKMNKQSFKDECYFQLYRDTEILSYCALIIDEDKHDMCYIRDATKRGDFSNCNVYKTDSYTQTCQDLA